MNRIVQKIFLACVICFCTAAAAQDPQVIRSAGWAIRIDKQSASATNTTHPKPVELYRDTKDSETREGHFYKMLSVVGSVVSYHYSYYTEGGAHPSYGSWFSTMDLNNKLEPVHILDFFDEPILMAALMQDSTIKSNMDSMVTDKMDVMLDNIRFDCEVNFQTLPTSWCINSIADGEAEICFGLTHGCEVMRGNFTLIKIKIPYKKALAEIFAEAERNKNTMQFLYQE